MSFNHLLQIHMLPVPMNTRCQFIFQPLKLVQFINRRNSLWTTTTNPRKFMILSHMTMMGFANLEIRSREKTCLMSDPDLLSLPWEVMKMIVGLVTLEEVFALSCTCKQLRRLLTDENHCESILHVCYHAQHGITQW